jgi:hypothetical protein
MAETRIADIIVPEQLTEMVTAEIANYMDFVKAGIAVKDYKNVDIRDGGHFAEVPFYKQLTGDDQVLTDDTSLVPGKIATGKDIGVVCHRGNAWASRDLAAILSGDDPMKEIAKQVASFWGKKSGQHLISVLRGVFDASAGVLKDTHRKQVGVTTGTRVTIASTSVIDMSVLAFGDMLGDVDALIVHSKVYGDMLKEKLVSFPERFDPSTVKVKGQSRGTYLGLDIIVSDDVYVNTGTTDYPLYSCYLARKGALYYGMQKDIMTENDRDILAQKDVLATTMHFVPHCKLVKWKVTTLNPTNAVLQTATNWEKVADDDAFIGVAELVVN